jgi:rubrerythrin
MIICKKCGFQVNGNLFYSTCPSCGSSLMTNDDIRSVKGILSKLKINNLLNSASDDEKYMLSVFIFNEFYKKEEAGSDEARFESESSAEPESVNVESFRDEIRSEYINKMSEIESFDEDEDEDDRVSRLRSLAKSSPIL